MSNHHNCAISGFGLFVPKAESFALASKFIKKNDFSEDFNTETLSETDLCDLAEYLPGEGTYYSDGYEGHYFISIDDKIISGEDAYCYFFWGKDPEPFKAVYSSVEECISYYKNLLGKYLPDDFDYRSHIGWFSCTVFC